jgi:hypothetical protein
MLFTSEGIIRNPIVAIENGLSLLFTATISKIATSGIAS